MLLPHALVRRVAAAKTYANRLKTASVGGVASGFAYDGDGKRASRTAGGVATSYTYDVNASLPVLLDDGARKYVWGLGLAYAVDSSGVLVYHTDGLGSVRALSDGAGAVVQLYRYDEYGLALESEGEIEQPFRYTGEQFDESTGLVYLRADDLDRERRRVAGGNVTGLLAANSDSRFLIDPQLVLNRLPVQEQERLPRIGP